MRFKTLALALFVACGPRTSQSFRFSQTASADTSAFIAAAEMVNTQAGCDMLREDIAGSSITFDSVLNCGKGSGEANGCTTLSWFDDPKISVHPLSSWRPAGTLAAQIVYIHELGHAAGLVHTLDHYDIMFADAPGYLADGAMARYVDQLRVAGNRCLTQ